ncbi:hypothetical protein FBU30_006097 [Linnemannia zychae]|nr:hypothetical protein FBU30_006097 [Linnemannia zychae]
MESEDGSHSPRSGSNHTRPPFEASGDIPGTFRGSILLDQHGRPYYPDGRPLEPRTRGPYWAHPSLYDPRFDFYQRGYDYGYDHLYEIPRRRQAGHGMPPREFAPWEHKEEGRYPSHHHLAPWSERESSSTWTRRHSTDTIDETSQDPESQCHSHPLQQDIGEGTDGRDKDRSKMQDVEMKDSTAIYNSKSPSALDSQLLFRRYQSRTPEVCTVSEDPLARTHQESITENTKRTIKVSGSSPSVSTLSAPFSTDSSLSGNLPFVTHVAGNSSRLPPTSNDTTSEHSKSTSLSPSPANYFPSLHIGPSSVPSSDPHTVVSSAIESPDASNFVRRWSSSDSSSANPSCDTKEPRVRLGQEGYYNKHDLEELYKSWLAKFEASQKNKLTLAQSHQLHRQQHQNNQSQQSRLDGMRNANSPASSSKDAIEDGRDLPNADKRKVKWKTVEFNSSQLKQQSQEKGSGSSCGKSDDRGISMTKQDASKRLSGKRIRQDPAIDVDPDGISGDLKGNKDDNHDMDDIIEQKNQTIDEYTDNEEGGVSPGSNSGSASVESLDLVHENVTKNMADDTLVNVSSASSALFDGQSRRIRIQENKSHQCDKCDKKFSRPSQLLTHSFTHSGETHT